MLGQMRRRVPWLVILLALGVGTVAHADGPTLHEYVPDVDEDEGAVLVTSGSTEPAGIVYDGEVLPPPAEGPLGSEETPMVATPGDGQAQEEPGRRSPTFRPDRQTELLGSVGYYESFNPAIAPFKRVTALDGVSIDAQGTPVLGVWDPRRRAVTIDGALATPPDSRPRDQFWGSVVLDFSGGRSVPFPSVSPESRILTLRTEPDMLLRIEKDGADNFHAVAVGLLVARQVRVIWLTDAPRSYFSAEIPETPTDAYASEVAPLPQAVSQSAAMFLAELGLTREMSLRETVHALVRHFRSFVESEDPPANTGDIFLDLARGMKGVCRHRAYAFVIAAHALGIPARFVQNEAHAWVEVKAGDVGWVRIDLGGAAHGLETHGADDRPMYRPDADTMPRPAAYEAAYEEARRNAREEERPGAGTSGGGAGPGTGATGGTAGEPLPVTQQGDPANTSMEPGRQRLGITVDEQRYSVFRGKELILSGRALGANGEGVAGLRVEVLLRADREVLLGVTVSREDGWFRGMFGVPPDVPVGDHRLIVRTPGNDQWLAAQAR
jgi:transglutaminase-like putative cysteine protease